MLAQRFGDRVNTTVRRQFFEYIVPVKPNGACADTKYQTDIFVGLTWRESQAAVGKTANPSGAVSAAVSTMADKCDQNDDGDRHT